MPDIGATFASERGYPTDKQLAIKELYEILESMGAKSDLLQHVGNWSDNTTDAQAAKALREWRERN